MPNGSGGTLPSYVSLTVFIFPVEFPVFTGMGTVGCFTSLATIAKEPITFYFLIFNKCDSMGALNTRKWVTIYSIKVHTKNLKKTLALKTQAILSSLSMKDTFPAKYYKCRKNYTTFKSLRRVIQLSPH